MADNNSKCHHLSFFKVMYSNKNILSSQLFHLIPATFYLFKLAVYLCWQFLFIYLVEVLNLNWNSSILELDLKTELQLETFSHLLVALIVNWSAVKMRQVQHQQLLWNITWHINFVVNFKLSTRLSIYKWSRNISATRRNELGRIEICQKWNHFLYHVVDRYILAIRISWIYQRK